jgi:hypothetical protein
VIHSAKPGPATCNLLPYDRLAIWTEIRKTDTIWRIVRKSKVSAAIVNELIEHRLK